MKQIQGKKLLKRNNNKSNFEKFVKSNYTDFDAFHKACKNDENLLIYTCITRNELLPFIEEIKKIESTEDQIKYLKNNQPAMNETEERYNVCIASIAGYLKNYITYNGFVMNNANGDAEDWTSEFWLKYTKICNFYRDRWFHPETLKRATTVNYNPLLYKEFVYVCRMAITGERRHQAFLATQRVDATLFKPSLDFRVDAKGDSDKSLMDVVKDPCSDSEITQEQTGVAVIIEKALDYAKKYENGKYYKEIEAVYVNQDLAETKDRKVVILAKIFLYKAGLISPRTLSFIKSLSSKYKAKFNISTALVNRQVAEFKKKKVAKVPTYHDVLEDGGKTRVGLILRKRGTVDSE